MHDFIIEGCGSGLVIVGGVCKLPNFLSISLISSRPEARNQLAKESDH